MCALFIGSQTAVSHHNIEKLGPVMVNKSIVQTLSHFLVERNAWYIGQVAVAESNINDLYKGNADSAIPQAIEVCFLRDLEDVSGGSSYSEHSDNEELPRPNDVDTVLLESVGYTEADHSPANYRLMKATALAHCLDGKYFLQARSGSNLVNDKNPTLLAWVFPQLDLFGIGGFNNPNCSMEFRLSFVHQLHNLLMQDNSPFACNPNFHQETYVFTETTKFTEKSDMTT
jgi:hypothetical protein